MCSHDPDRTNTPTCVEPLPVFCVFADSIEANVETTHVNVQSGTQHLSRASAHQVKGNTMEMYYL